MGAKKSKTTDSQTNINDRVKSNEISQSFVSHGPIYRLAIGQPAGIGSFYNAREDLLLNGLRLPVTSKVQLWEDLSKHVVRNLSELMEIDPELHLSIKLNLINDIQLSSLFSHQSSSNNLTRIFSYHYINQIKYIAGERDLLKSNIEQILQYAIATHVVTEISLGVFVFVLIEFPSIDEYHIDTVLEKITDQLKDNHFNLSDNDKEILEKIISTRIFSNVSELSQSTKLIDIHEKLVQIRPNTSVHHPVKYTLRPIISLVQISPERYQYTPLVLTTIKKIEQHLNELLRILKLMEVSFTRKDERLLEKYLQDPYNRIQKLISSGRRDYQMRLHDVCDAVKAMRVGVCQRERLEIMGINEQNQLFENMAKTIQNKFNDLKKKMQLMKSLKKKGVIYLNVKQIIKEDDENLEKIKEQLLNDNNTAYIFCFDDRFGKVDSQPWKEFYQELIAKNSENLHPSLIYADFSYCSCQLTRFEELLSKDICEEMTSGSKERSSLAMSSLLHLSLSLSSVLKSTESLFQSEMMDSGTNAATTQSVPSEWKGTSPKRHKKKFINVLLLGESGVGKSTFINAIVNYLQFENFPAAHSGEPIVLTPVSFLMTQGDNFEERIVTFGKQDPNENHNNTGQSVTQHCRSYVFTVGTKTKIRLIDTPGMGDTRGLDQDDRNMEHILSFISHLPHLNAICILLKPNESRLNVVLRSYFNRLVGFLGEHVRDNIVFCFTNTRSTFFAPGNTGPLLKKMLQSHSIKDIPYGKTNTFCFDSESFRYLVARINGIAFDDYQKEEYERSWITSASESHRLLQYICSGLKSYPQKKWQSIEHAHFQIVRLTRPLLETMRNNLRNIIKMERSSSKSLIEISANPVNYQIQYEAPIDEKNSSLDELKADVDWLKRVLVEFIYFHKYMMNISREKDPILVVLNEMIDEENKISSQQDSDSLNSILRDELESMKKTCATLWTTAACNRPSMTLSDVYQQIKIAGKNRAVMEQLDAIRQTEEMYMADQEKHVS